MKFLYATLLLAAVAQSALAPLPASAQPCEAQCESDLRMCRDQKPEMVEENDEPDATRRARLAACTNNQKVCVSACRSGQKTVMGTPPGNCIAMKETARRKQMDSNCGHGLHEMWMLVENTHRPGCPVATEFTFVATLEPLRDNTMETPAGPFRAPKTVQTCGVLPQQLKTTRQQVPDLAPAAAPQIAGPPLKGLCGNADSGSPNFLDCETAKRSLASARSPDLRRSNPAGVEEEYRKAADALSSAGDIESQNQVLHELDGFKKSK